MSRNRSNFVRVMGTASAVVLSSTLAVPAVAIAADADDNAEILALDEKSDQEEADKVKDLIDLLPAASVLTRDDADPYYYLDDTNVTTPVKDARDAYDALSVSQQKLVSNYALLERVESKIAEFKAEAKAEGQAVADAINKLPETDKLTLGDSVAVQNVAAAYDALAIDAKSEISAATKGKLLDARAKIEELREDAAEDVQAASDAIDLQLKDLDLHKVSLGDEAEVKKAKAALQRATSIYDELDDDKKAAVENAFNLLNDAYEAKQEAYDAYEKASDNLEEVEKQGYVSPAPEWKAANEAKQKAWDAYEEADAAYVEKANNLTTDFTTAEHNLLASRYGMQGVQDALEADPVDAVEEAIDDLDEVWEILERGAEGFDRATLAAQGAAIDAALAKYNELTPAQKSEVENYKKLADSKARYDRCVNQWWAARTDRQNATNVINLIEALPSVDELSLDNNDDVAVAAAREAYDNLTDEYGKPLVSNYGKLVSAEARIEELKGGDVDKKAAEAVEAKIAALPALEDLTYGDKEAVEAARAAYDALTDAQKALVSEDALKALEAAEKKIEELKPVVASQVYRLYNPNSGEHFYTADEAEKDALTKIGWTNETSDTNAWFTTDEMGDAVYRLYNPNAEGGDHHYTMDSDEVDALVKAGWQKDNDGKPVFYSADSESGVAIYRAYNPNEEAHNHNYTPDKAEQDALVKAGWNDEKVAFYGQRLLKDAE